MRMTWLGDLFSTGPKRANLRLDVGLDRHEGGDHIVHVSAHAGEDSRPVDDLREFASYGFTIQENGVQYRLEPRDRELLLALLALNPRKQGEGEFHFKVRPPILDYVRREHKVEETSASEQVKILDEPLEAEARVDYDPSQGFEVEVGYPLEGEPSLVGRHELPLTEDGGYIRVGSSYRPVPEELPEELKGYVGKGKVSVPVKDVPEFFQRDLVLIKSECKAVLTDQAEKIKVFEDSIKPRVTVDRNEPGWLDFKVDYVIWGYTVPSQRIREARNDVVQVDDFTYLKTDLDAVEYTELALEELGAEETESGYRVPIERFSSLQEFMDTIGGEQELAAEYQKFLDQLTSFTASDDFELPRKVETRLENVGVELRPYQRAGVHWLDWLRRNHLHGALADDMGLGKTLQSILVMSLAYLSDNSPDRHSLVVAPRSVLHHWTREIHRFAPELRTVEYHGQNRPSRLLRSSQPRVFITTYATAARDIEDLGGVPFLYLILDEATRIKNPSAQRTQAMKRLNAVHRITLTGTPIENRPEELWSQFDFLIRGHLGRLGTFERYYANPISAGNRQRSTELADRIRPFIMRRTKEEVAKELPDKIEMDEWCELTDEQKALYGQIQDQFVPSIRQELQEGKTVNRISILPILTKLKQVCDHPAIISGEVRPVHGRSEKFDLAVEKIREIQNLNEQVVLFSHFLDMLNLFEIALSEGGVSYIRLDGSVTNRQALIDKFTEGNVTVALCSLQAMSHGVNLQTANHVIHVDRWWNPAVEDQATDRVHRIGQERNVYVYRLIAQGTLEEKIDKLQERKRGLSDQVVGAATGGEMSWTRDELLEILKPLAE